MRHLSIVPLILGSVFLAGCDREYREMDSEELIHWASTFEEEDYRKSISLYSMAIDRATDDAVLAEARRKKGVFLIKHGMGAEGNALLLDAAEYYSFTYLLSNDPRDIFQFGLCVIHLGYEDEFWTGIDRWIEEHPEATDLRTLRTVMERRRESQGPNKPASSSPNPLRVD